MTTTITDRTDPRIETNSDLYVSRCTFNQGFDVPVFCSHLTFEDCTFSDTTFALTLATHRNTHLEFHGCTIHGFLSVQSDNRVLSDLVIRNCAYRGGRIWFSLPQYYSTWVVEPSTLDRSVPRFLDGFTPMLNFTDYLFVVPNLVTGIGVSPMAIVWPPSESEPLVRIGCQCHTADEWVALVNGGTPTRYDDTWLRRVRAQPRSTTDAVIAYVTQIVEQMRIRGRGG